MRKLIDEKVEDFWLWNQTDAILTEKIQWKSQVCRKLQLVAFMNYDTPSGFVVKLSKENYDRISSEYLSTWNTASSWKCRVKLRVENVLSFSPALLLLLPLFNRLELFNSEPHRHMNWIIIFPINILFHNFTFDFVKVDTKIHCNFSASEIILEF